MIVSHQHKFIFIKNRKVAGTSMEVALASICGPEDILSPASPVRGQKGRNELARHARNYDGRFNPISEIVLDLRPASVARVLRDWLQRHTYYNHMRASSIRARVGAEIWDSYYKFCFERNPWDKMVSFYYWYNRARKDPPEINDFICGPMSGATVDQKYPTDWERYTLGNRLIVDDVFDYGDLSGNLATALERAGLDHETISQVQLGHFKSGTRSKDPVRLTAESDAVIRRIFAREIAQFGYVCPPHLTP